MRATSSFCALAVAIAGAAGIAQDRQTPTFKTGVQLVRIDVSVLDGTRQPVRGLQASDFTVLEDGQPRPIRSFQAVDAAAARAKATSAISPIALLPAHNVVTNQVSSDTSRLIFILLDRSIEPERPMIVARQIADAAVDAMAPGDQAAIVTTGLLVPQNLTSDRARLHKTIAASDWSQRLSQAQLDDPIIGQKLGMGDVMGDPRCMCGLCVMDTIARIANDVRDVPRRKVLLFIGSSIIVQAGPRDFSLDVGCEKRVRDSREKLFEALGTSGLTVHSIDPNGLASVGPAARASVPNGIENRDGAALNAQLTQERNDFMAAQGTLRPARFDWRPTILNSNEPFRMCPTLSESDVLPARVRSDRARRRATPSTSVARKGVAVHTARFTSVGVDGRGDRCAAGGSPLERAHRRVPNQSVPSACRSPRSLVRRRTRLVGLTPTSAFATKPGSMPLEIAVLASDARAEAAACAAERHREVPPGGRAGGVAASSR